VCRTALKALISPTTTANHAKKAVSNAQRLCVMNVCKVTSTTKALVLFNALTNIIRITRNAYYVVSTVTYVSILMSVFVVRLALIYTIMSVQ
jgi:cytochrome c oxidase subunit IV